MARRWVGLNTVDAIDRQKAEAGFDAASAFSSSDVAGLCVIIAEYA